MRPQTPLTLLAAATATALYVRYAAAMAAHLGRHTGRGGSSTARGRAGDAPRRHLGPALEQCPTLALRHGTPCSLGLPAAADVRQLGAEGGVCRAHAVLELLLYAYRFTPWTPKSTIVVFGGFDSYIEEWSPALLFLRDAGYDVVAFDGPGQGAALEDAHLPMQPDWERPVTAVLDHFDLDDVTLLGISLGGCLAVPAAAKEPRVSRVGPAEGMAAVLAGPQEHEMVDLACRVVRANGQRRRVVGVRIPGAAGRAMADGGLLPIGPGPRGKLTFEQWLAACKATK